MELQQVRDIQLLSLRPVERLIGMCHHHRQKHRLQTFKSLSNPCPAEPGYTLPLQTV